MAASLADLDGRCLATLGILVGRSLRAVCCTFCEATDSANGARSSVMFRPSLEALEELAKDLGLDAKRQDHRLWQFAKSAIIAALENYFSVPGRVVKGLTWRNGLAEMGTPFSGRRLLGPEDTQRMFEQVSQTADIEFLCLEQCGAGMVSAAALSMSPWTQLRSLELISCCVDEAVWESLKAVPQLERFAFFGGNSTQLPLPSSWPFDRGLRELALAPIAPGGSQGDTWKQLLHSTGLLSLHVNAIDTRCIAHSLVAVGSCLSMRVLSLSPKCGTASLMDPLQAAGLLVDDDMSALLASLSPSLEVLLLSGQQKLSPKMLPQLLSCKQLRMLGLKGCTGLSSLAAAELLLNDRATSCAPALEVLEIPSPEWECLSLRPNLQVVSCAESKSSTCSSGLCVHAGKPICIDGCVELAALISKQQGTAAPSSPTRARGWAGGTPSVIRALVSGQPTGWRFSKEEAARVSDWCRERRRSADAEADPGSPVLPQAAHVEETVWSKQQAAMNHPSWTAAISGGTLGGDMMHAE